jgi:hypothetical protein
MPDYLSDTPEVQAAFRVLVRAAARTLGLNGDGDTLAERHLLADDLIITAVLGKERAAKRHAELDRVRPAFEQQGIILAHSHQRLPDTPEVAAAISVLREAASDDYQVMEYVHDSSVDEFIAADLDLDPTDRVNPRLKD